MTPTRFVCWGDVGLDAYQDEPQPRPGGCALNVAWSLRLAGASRVGVAGWIGPDGAHLRDLLRDRGVDVSALRVVAGATPRQRIKLRPDGEREFCGYEAGVLAARLPDAEFVQALGRADRLYLPVFDVTVSWAEVAWRSGAPVVLDLMTLEDVDEAFAAEALERSHAVFCGLDAERDQARIERLCRLAQRLGRATLVITLGEAGALAVEGSRRLRVPAQPLPGGLLVDTTGCGDAFAGTFLAARAQGQGLEAALAAGARRGAEVAAHRGAVRIDTLPDGPPGPIMQP